MEAALLAFAVPCGLLLAAWRMVRRWDPPYEGAHERVGRHRTRPTDASCDWD